MPIGSEIAIGIPFTENPSGTGGGVPPTPKYLVMEDGVSFVLQEDGSKILLQAQ